MIMNKGRALLTNYTFNPKEGTVYAEFDIEQNNGKTSVEQKMILECENIDALSTQFNGQMWKAEILLDDFPPQKTPQAAAEKLADWLERLADGIRAGEYSLPTHSIEFKDMNDEAI